MPEAITAIGPKYLVTHEEYCEWQKHDPDQCQDDEQGEFPDDRTREERF